MLVANRMTRKPVCISPQDTLAQARLKMDAGNFRRLPVIEQRRLVGIISESDLRQHVGHLEHVKVAAAMTPDPITVDTETTVEDAARLMTSSKIGAVPVVEDGRLVGILTTTDALKAFVDVMEALAEVET